MIYGIEQEIPLLKNDQAVFVDYSNTVHGDLQKIVDELPTYAEDYPKLRVGDLGIKKKRWYVEGFERFNEDGSLNKSVPKSLEIRTAPGSSAEGVVNELVESYKMLLPLLNNAGFDTVWLSFNPQVKEYIPDPPFNECEKQLRSSSPEMITASIAQLSFGPDLSISFSESDGVEMSDEQLIDIGKKLTYYSPGIIPFSFSSPFYDGKLWSGSSIRTYLRTGRRPAVMVFLYDNQNLIPSQPSLTQPARVEFEKGRIEFKAFDTCNDPNLYLSLFALLEGLALDQTLPGRALVPDERLHKLSAQEDFANPEIRALGLTALNAAKNSLDPKKAKLLDPLFEMLADPDKLPVKRMINTYKETGSIIKTLSTYENLNV